MAATGIDTITAEAGVAKTSLYDNFSPKAGLVRAEGPCEGVPAVLDAYADHAAFAYEHGFRGCGLFNAIAELPAGHEGQAVVRGHKEEVERLTAGHLEQVLPGRRDEARSTAEHLSSLLEGAWPAPARRATVRASGTPAR